MRNLHHPSVEELELTSAFYALSDPIRLQIVRSLTDCTGKTCGAFGVEHIAKSTFSHHLKVLRECGLTYVRVEGTQRFVSLRMDDWERRYPGLLSSILQAAGSRINA